MVELDSDGVQLPWNAARGSRTRKSLVHAPFHWRTAKGSYSKGDWSGEARGVSIKTELCGSALTRVSLTSSSASGDTSRGRCEWPRLNSLLVFLLVLIALGNCLNCFAWMLL